MSDDHLQRHELADWALENLNVNENFALMPMQPQRATVWCGFSAGRLFGPEVWIEKKTIFIEGNRFLKVQ